MADHRFDEPTGGRGDAAPPPIPAWEVYDGRPEPVSDGLPATSPPKPRTWHRWAWLVPAVAIAIGTAGPGTRPHPDPEPAMPAPAAFAPERWTTVDESLAAGLVPVYGGAEADGIVLTPSGLVATSHSRLMGDHRPRGEGGVWIAAGGRNFMEIEIVADEESDVAVLRAAGFVPSSVAVPGTPVREDETLTLLDIQGGRDPVLGIGVTVTKTDQVCSRAGSKARPTGFRFTLQVATAEPGAALVRADGTVVGMYYGGDDATHHCAIPIADVLKTIDSSAQ